MIIFIIVPILIKLNNAFFNLISRLSALLNFKFMNKNFSSNLYIYKKMDFFYSKLSAFAKDNCNSYLKFLRRSQSVIPLKWSTKFSKVVFKLNNQVPVYYRRSVTLLKSFLGKILFGKDFDLRLGRYEKDNPDRLSYPIIILNGKLLLELDTNSEKTIAKFFRVLDDNVYIDNTPLLHNKLKELLEGKDFPIESFNVPVYENIEGISIYPKTEMPLDDRYRPTRLPINFALKVHKISQEADYKNFLNYILSFYFGFNIWYKDEVEDYGFESDEIHNLFMTSDLSQFIIYQEQADSYADFLEKHFKDEIAYRRKNGLQTTFGVWFEKLIKNLRTASLPFFSPSQKVEYWPPPK